ncbi:hypothetical protein A4A49_63595, partial [Nicotiana attenuata]
NYMLWRELFLPVFKGHGVYGFIDGSYPCPESTLTMDNGTSVTNPAFQQWVQLDSIVLSWIQATISQEILQAIIRPNQILIARKAWLQIERLFHDHVSSRTLQLKIQFHNLKKGSLSIADYVHRLKSISDALTSIGNPISDSDLVLQILSGLPSEYLSVSTSISTRVPLPTFLETRSLLFLYETQLTGFSSTASDSSTALVAKKNSSSQGRGRGRNSNAPHSTISSVYPTYPFSSSFQCQLCFQPTHAARDCPFLGSKALFFELQSSSSGHSYTPPSNPQWYVDTGASSHMTPTTSNLSSIQPYNGNDSVMVGNSNQLPISYTGNGNISTHSSTFSLKNILVVPTLSCNLLSVRKFTSDNNCSIDFDAFGFSIKDYKTK